MCGPGGLGGPLAALRGAPEEAAARASSADRSSISKITYTYDIKRYTIDKFTFIILIQQLYTISCYTIVDVIDH